jgi:hypothetical protein
MQGGSHSEDVIYYHLGIGSGHRGGSKLIHHAKSMRCHLGKGSRPAEGCFGEQMRSDFLFL